MPALNAGLSQITSLMIPSMSFSLSSSSTPIEKVRLMCLPCASSPRQNLARRIGVHQLVAAAPQPIERRGFADRIEPLAQKGSPVIGLHRIQRLHDVIEGEGDDGEAAVADAEEGARKIVERAFALGSFSYQGIGVEPDEGAFVVVVLEALPAGPRLRPA